MNEISNLKSKISRLIFSLKKPKVIIIAGKNRTIIKEKISDILKGYPDIKNNLVFFETDLKDSENLKFLIKNSSLPIFIASELEENKEIEGSEKLAKTLPQGGFLISNFDDENIKILGKDIRARSLTFGFQQGADFQASDMSSSNEANFKINYKGSIVPVWIKGPLDKEKMYPILAAAVSGLALDLNLVEISQALKFRQS